MRIYIFICTSVQSLVENLVGKNVMALRKKIFLQKET